MLSHTNTEVLPKKRQPLQYSSYTPINRYPNSDIDTSSAVALGPVDGPCGHLNPLRAITTRSCRYMPLLYVLYVSDKHI